MKSFALLDCPLGFTADTDSPGWSSCIIPGDIVFIWYPLCLSIGAALPIPVGCCLVIKTERHASILSLTEIASTNSFTSFILGIVLAKGDISRIWVGLVFFHKNITLLASTRSLCPV